MFFGVLETLETTWSSILRSYDFHRMPAKSLANASADFISRLQRHGHEKTCVAIKGLISELAVFFRFRLHCGNFRFAPSNA